jgi:hypothetical protein
MLLKITFLFLFFFFLNGNLLEFIDKISRAKISYTEYKSFEKTEFYFFFLKKKSSIKYS